MEARALAPPIGSAASGEAYTRLGRAFSSRNQDGRCLMRGLLLPRLVMAKSLLVLRFKLTQFRRVLLFKGLVIVYLLLGASLTSTPVTMQTLHEMILMPVVELPALLAQAPCKDPPVCMEVVL